jgi:CDP-diacylglycerol---glycerol-3-phosphate 3-phosphatidyltransferase
MAVRDPAKLFPHDKVLRPIIALFPSFIKPNHLTMLRFFMTPIVLWLLVIEQYEYGVPLFLLATITDALDGTMARIRSEITEWGTFYDPLADKILIGSVILLVVIRYVNPWIAAALILVELLLIGGGWYRRERGRVKSANIWGKVKMLLQVIGVMFLLISLMFGVDFFVDLSQGTLILAIVFAVVSLFTYSL